MDKKIEKIVEDIVSEYFYGDTLNRVRPRLREIIKKYLKKNE